MDDRGAAISARLDRIPVWPYPRSVLWIVGFGFFFAFFDIVTIGFAIPVISKQFGVSSELASWTISGSLIGYIIGSFFDSRIGDRFGRKVSLLISVSLFTIGSLMSATSSDIWWLIGWRVISGMGIGAEIAAVSTFLGELSPAKIRGRNTAFAIAAGMLGFALVPFAALALVPNFDWGWRALFVIGALGGLAIGLTRRNLPASARWLVSRGRMDEAEEVVSRAEQVAETIMGHELSQPEPVESHPPMNSGFATLFKPPYLQRVLLIALVWFFYYVGNYAWLTMAPTLFVKEGYSLSHSIMFMVLMGVGFVVGAAIAIQLSDKAERKFTISFICIVWAASLLVIGWKPSNTLIIVCGFIASATIGALIPILYTYTAENFPTGIRATGVSATDGFGHLGGALAPLVVHTAFSLWNFQGAFTVMAITGVLAAFLLMFGIKTTGKSLTETGQN